MTSNVPFSTFRGFVKCVRPNQLGEAPARALDQAFHGFFVDEPPNVEGNRLIEPVLGKIGTRELDELPYRYRRFGGGTTLSRGCYFSIASSEAGDDGGTLACELGAYADEDIFLCCVDSADPMTFHGIGRFEDLRYPRVPLAPRTLAVFHHLESGEPFTWTQHADGQIGCTIVPYDVRPVTIERIVDLREAAVQQWLYSLVVKEGMPGVGYYYPPNHIVTHLVVRGERPTQSDKDLGLIVKHFGSGRLRWLPPRPGWDWIPRDGPADFLGLLPFLVFPCRGGTPITEAIGRHLRRIGVGALIFPSARRDCACGENSQPYRGWNLVDYRDSPRDLKDTWHIVSPDSWWGFRENCTVKISDDHESWSIVSHG